MTNMSAPYPRISCINAVFIRYYLSPSIRMSLHAYTQVRIAAMCFSLLRTGWYSNYEMCRFQQRDREERESEGGQHASVFVCLARRVYTRGNTCV